MVTSRRSAATSAAAEEIATPVRRTARKPASRRVADSSESEDSSEEEPVVPASTRSRRRVVADDNDDEDFDDTPKAATKRVPPASSARASSAIPKPRESRTKSALLKEPLTVVAGIQMNADIEMDEAEAAPLHVKEEEDVETDHKENAEKLANLKLDPNQHPINTHLPLPPKTAPITESEGPRRRVVITHLVLYNFKSYAGRQEIGPFHTSFSSVVGPNGSGKSNVIDSLLFVFGFRASKMRQGKISALIHNSAQHPDLDSCAVEVHFQEVIDVSDGKTEVVPNSRLIVAREAFKNNSSRYTLNGGTSNYTEVTALLRDKGIDLDHKRFLILQGEVESIAQMKPKAQGEHDDGLLEYLEDIIGTSKYKKPIEETAQEVEALGETFLEKSNRVALVEKEKAALEDKKNQVLEYIRDENELVSKQSLLYQVYIAGCNQNIEVTNEITTELRKELEAEQAAHKGNEDEIKKLEKLHAETSKEYGKIEKQATEVSKELAHFDREEVQLQEKLKHAESKQKKAAKTMQTSKHSLSESTTWIQNYEEENTKHNKQLAVLEKNLLEQEKELEDIRQSLKSKTQGLSDEIERKQKTLEPWTARVNDKVSAIAVMQSELNMLQEKSTEAERAIEETNEQISRIIEEGQAKEAELAARQKEGRSVTRDIASVRAKLEEANARGAKLRDALSKARQSADEGKASLAASQTQGNVLSGLMRLKESGRVQGFHGRLGSLGTIDAKYDVAISTACPALENMVVDSVEVGQQCIDYLRKNNLGRAMFILLDRLSARNMNPIETPENAPRLFDLVKPKDPRFAPAFYSVLQNTLVAADLEQANRIAYGKQRWRVVTLDGQLIDKSGTMTGGGTRVARGGMSSKLVAEVSREKVGKLEQDRDALETEHKEFLEEHGEHERGLQELLERHPQLEVIVSKIGLELKSLQKNLEDAQTRLNELSVQPQQSASEAKRMIKLQSDIAKSEKELAQIRSEMSGVEDEIKLLQDKIMEVGGVRLRTQKAKVDSLREQIETLNERITAADVARSKAHKDSVKHTKALDNAQREFDNIANDLKAIEERMVSQQEQSRETRQRAEQARDLLETKAEELSALKADLDEKTEALNAIRAEEIEMQNKLKEHEKVLLENEKRLVHWTERLTKLSLHNISDFQDNGTQQVAELPVYSQDELEDVETDSLKGEIAVLEEKTQNTKVDFAVLDEYRRRLEEYQARRQDLETATNARDTAKKRYDDLRKRRLEEFMEGFNIISLRLKEMYQMITMGGNAELELVDSLDPFSEGILFSVMPPKKSWKNISNLSGGEKTLSSLALVFALHHFKPTPLYVMDEIDAALDFRNVSIVANYIKERTKNAQFIVISLRNNMFELASRLVGIYKTANMTKSITIENKDFLRRSA
ncbi:Structural maintenance of chromosomes protein 4 [Saitoella coloradoensis]